MSSSEVAINRLQKDYISLLQDPLPSIEAHPLEDNIFEWHFVILGSPDTPYEGGVYHGILIFNSSFPFKAPSIMMLTPSGRFLINTKICLSVSDFHPEMWNPTWTVGSIVLAVQSFMNGEFRTYGSVSSSDSVRRKLAKESRKYNLNNPVFCRLFEQLSSKIRYDFKKEEGEKIAKEKIKECSPETPNSSRKIEKVKKDEEKWDSRERKLGHGKQQNNVNANEDALSIVKLMLLFLVAAVLLAFVCMSFV